MPAYVVDSIHRRVSEGQAIPSETYSSHYSQLYDQEMGVPQRSILSVTLFGLKINSIVKAISPGVECSLYVDDFLICYRSKYINIIEKHIQRCLNKISIWQTPTASTSLLLKQPVYISVDSVNYIQSHHLL